MLDVIAAIDQFGEVDAVSVGKDSVYVRFKSDISGFKDWQVEISGERPKIESVSEREKSDVDSRPSSSSSSNSGSAVSLEMDDNPILTTLRYLSKKKNNNSLLVKCLMKSVRRNKEKCNFLEAT